MSQGTGLGVSDAATLAAIVQSSADAIITKDLRGVITTWNKAAEVLFGYSADEAIGKPVTILIPDDRLDEEPGILARIRRGESIEHYETVRQAKDGSLIDISLTVSPVRDDAGTIIGASKIARDITERRLIEAERRRYVSIIESSSDAIITKDLDGVIQSWNPGAADIFGYTADEVIGKSVTILIPDERIDEEPGILARIRRGEHVDHYETVRKRKDGTLLDISLNVSPILDAHGVIVGASKIARDVTEHNRLHRVEREADLMHRLVQTQEAERARIARDLHDQIGQHMTAMRLNLETMSQATVDDADLDEQIAKLKAIAHKIDRDLTFLAWELRPTELENLGLRNALDSYLKEWQQHCGINGHFEFEGDAEAESLTAGAETHIYRIVQEALNNVAKHSDASDVTVLMHRQRNIIFLIVEDNGVGFDMTLPAESESGHGNGISGMNERVAILNGKLLIESSPGKGTTVAITIPIS